MNTYRYKKRDELFERAAAVIPSGIYGHLGPAEGCFIPAAAYPFFADRAEGAYFYDVDGNRFIDYMCAYGPNVLGYNRQEVNDAARAQWERGDCMTLPAESMVLLAECLVDTVASADWAFFAKNGGDVTNLAMLAARAHTGRDLIVKFSGGYHGVAPWMQAYGSPGILAADVEKIVTLPWNRIDLFRALLQKNPGRIAGLISTPYSHPAMFDSELPADGFWQEVRSLCTEHGVVLICDDVRAGFRLDLRGSDHYYGFKADLICFSKAIANGYPVSALCGRHTFRNAVGSVFNTGSFWLSAVPFAAAVKTIELLKQTDGPALMRRVGETLTKGLTAIAAEHGYHLLVTGEPALWSMRLTDDDSGVLHQKWVAECVKRGAFFTNHHNLFINCAMSKRDISDTFEIADDAFRALRRKP